MGNARGRRDALVALAFAALAFIAFGPALAAPFDFDDGPAITENASIRQLWPPSSLWRMPPLGSAVSGRPTANVSFAINYALNARLGVEQSPGSSAPAQTIGFHVVNVLLHVAAALLLFVVIRRTIRNGRVPDAWRDAAEPIAGVVAAIWLVHPIQTEAVDYVSQRTELLVSVCYLATLYAAIRAWPGERGAADVSENTSETSVSRSRRVWWSIAAVVACLVGMGSKEVMLSAPLIVVLYDRAFLSGGWRAPWRMPARRALYAGLFATTLCSIALIAAGARGGTVGFDAGVSWPRYLYSQAWAIARYLRLTLWPTALTFDYGTTPVAGWLVLPAFVALAAAVVATVAAWRRPAWHWLAFIGSWFFVLLAPSSSIVPIATEIAAERRVYLALAGVIVLLVVGIESLRRRLVTRTTPSPAALRTSAGVVTGAFAVVVVALVAASYRRSAMYVDLEARWTDAIARTPRNGRVYDNLAAVLLREHPPRIAEADGLLHQAMAVDSMFVGARVRSATIAMSQERWRDAETLLVHALRIRPGDAPASDKLAKVLLAQRRPELALPYAQQFAAFSPTSDALTTLGLTYLMTQRVDLAIAVLKRAAQLDATRADTRRYLGAVLIEQERGAEAIPYLEEASRLEPTAGVTFGMLSLAYAQAGRATDASVAADAAGTRASGNSAAFLFGGRAMQVLGRDADAVRFFEAAVALSPGDPQALSRLGMAESSLGHAGNATRLFQRALALAPNYPLAVRGLGGVGRR